MARRGLAQNAIKIILVDDEITKQKVDVIVNTVGGSLELNIGGISGSILAAAGPGLQEDLNENYPNGIKYGEIAFTAGYNLHCKHIFHISLRSGFSADSQTELSEITEACLAKANNDGNTSIAFPALGTGALRYPPANTAHIMLEIIRQFQTKTNSLKEVVIVIYKNPTVLQAFQQELTRKATAPISKREVPAFKSCIEVNVIDQDISKMKVDVIVNSTDLKLNQGFVSIAILKTAGEEIQEECYQNYPNGIHPGEIARTGGYNMSCKEVFHVFIRREYAQDTQTCCKELQDIVERCLVEANNSGYTSIAFPAFGTGTLLYPPCVSARVMSNTINSFKNTTQNSTLKKIFISVHKNLKTFQIFQQAFQINKHFVKVSPLDASGLPKIWEGQPHEGTYCTTHLEPYSEEYLQVEGNFLKTLGKASFTVTCVERIQNPALYKQYEMKKQQLTTSSEFYGANEKLLWHGTQKASVDGIIVNGFNRSYAALFVHGKGVYFAVNSEYSAVTYSIPDEHKNRYILQCKVLVGHPVVGNKKMTVLPNRVGAILFDSATDNVLTPSMFVIFHDTQAYPEYLITFK